MLKVLTKIATYVEGVWHRAGEEILIAEHHFSDEVHTLLEDLDPKPVAEPDADSTETDADSTEPSPAASQPDGPVPPSEPPAAAPEEAPKEPT